MAHPALRSMELSFISSFHLSTAKSTISTASSSQLRVLDRNLSQIGLVALEERSWATLDVVLEVRLPNLYQEISGWAGNPSRSLRASRLGYRELYAIGLSKTYSLIQERYCSPKASTKSIASSITCGACSFRRELSHSKRFALLFVA